MGVRGLTALLQRLAPDSVRARQITHYNGRTLAVDVSCFLNRFIYGLDPHPARVQRGVHRLSLYLELNGIKPIFVFDMKGRIFEKQRETERREIAKEKVQKSFRLEIKRKKRIGGLKGPAMVLKTWTDEQLSEFLENIPADLSKTSATTADPTSTPASSPASPLSSPSSSSLSPSVPSSSNGPGEESSSGQATLRSISALEPLEDMRFLHEEDENIEAGWLWEQSDLSDEDLSKFGVSSSPVIDQGIEDDLGSLVSMILVDEPSEHDLDVPESLHLDLDSVIDLDLVPYLSLTEQKDGEDGSDSTLWKDIRTGTSIQHLIPAAELALLDFGDPTSPGFDRRVQEKVHTALVQFVRSMESPSGQNILLHENLNQRQKALSELEQKLVRDIKEVYRLKTKDRSLEAVASEISLEDDADVGSSDDTKTKEDVWEEKVSVFENAANTQAGTKAIDNAATLQDAWSEEAGKDMNSFSGAIAVDELEERDDTAKGSIETKKPAFVGDTSPSSENGGPMSENIEQVQGDTALGSELEESRNLRSTLKDVLSAHQSILMTLERRTMRVTRPLVKSCQDLLRAMGQPVIEAQDAEAESVCARLVTLGLADGTVSEDTDTAVFGNGILLRQLGSGNNKDILEINPLLAHAGLGLSRDAFRDFCILCGTDFSGKLEGVGPFRAAKLIRNFGSIESVMANTEYKAQDDFFYDHARRVFDRLPIVPNDPQVYHRKMEQQPQLTELLLKYDINPLEVRMELIKEMETYGSTGLEPAGLREDPFVSDPFSSNPFSSTRNSQSEMNL